MLGWGSAFPLIPAFLLCSSVLRIGSNPVETSSLGQTDEGNDSLAVMVYRAARGSLIFLWIRAREKLTKFGILAALNI